jgi:glycosyltransferase involved in cell wall biosynthesis
MKSSRVVCVHIGARAHYLLPKALHVKKNLIVLVTDTWIASPVIQKLLHNVPLRLVQSFAHRYSPAIPKLIVCSSGLYFAWMEISLRLFYANGWLRIIARNNLFQNWANHILRKQKTYTAVLGISYTSVKVFQTAKKNGKRTILYQMDPALGEERIVYQLIEENKEKYPTSWEKAPELYWQHWKEECSLADCIMVNSDWSRKALIQEGIEAEKIHIVPLPFELGDAHLEFNRTYPQRFQAQRPLICLFLGTLTLRKGIHLVLDAAQRMKNEHIEFILVGNSELEVDWKAYPNVSYKGVCSRAETEYWYKQADVFLFPTFSDGFGLTQLEAMAWKLPVIASTNCGAVVQQAVNGMILTECTTEQLVLLLQNCLNEPTLLKELSVHCQDRVSEFSVNRFAEQLAELL